jgi:heat shock protein HslJ
MGTATGTVQPSTATEHGWFGTETVKTRLERQARGARRLLLGLAAAQRLQPISPTRARIVFLTIAISVCHPAIGRPQEKIGSWMDASAPAPWNTRGVSIPVAPKMQGTIDARCKEQARPAQSAEDKRVQDHGWDLIGAFHGGWEMIVIRGAASYDGMCRPRQYQDFVFVRGGFAGTLSPQPMDSRTDGALGRVTLQSNGRVTAEYDRYAESDPLCCPSRTTAVVFDVANDGPVVRPVSSTTQTRGGATQTRGGAAFVGGTQTSGATRASELAGTSWQLVKFLGSDDTLAPDDRAKYTIQFAAGGRLTARIDCNHGQGTWTSSDTNQIVFGPLALTRVQCPAGSLHEQLMKQWGNIRSYIITDGHLFLALMADGGIYEFEPT